MSRFSKYFSKEHLTPETERGKYFFRNDSLFFQTVCHFAGEAKRHAINSHYRGIKVSADTLWLEGENQYSVKKDTSRFYFLAFKKAKQE